MKAIKVAVAVAASVVAITSSSASDSFSAAAEMARRYAAMCTESDDITKRASCATSKFVQDEAKHGRTWFASKEYVLVRGVSRADCPQYAIVRHGALVNGKAVGSDDPKNVADACNKKKNAIAYPTAASGKSSTANPAAEVVKPGSVSAAKNLAQRFVPLVVGGFKPTSEEVTAIKDDGRITVTLGAPGRNTRLSCSIMMVRSEVDASGWAVLSHACAPLRM